MTPAPAQLALAERVRTCRTHDDALRIAAELVMMTREDRYLLSEIADQFGNALLEIFEEQEAGRGR